MTLVRQKEAVINTDRASFVAAKRRKEHMNYIQSLDQRLCKLEEVVQCLTNTIEDINKK